MNRFDQRIVALVDVLGLSEVLSQPSESKRYAGAIDAIMSPIVRQRDEPWLVLPHVWTGEEIEVDIAFPVTKGSRITAISDAILVSVPIGSRSGGAEILRRIFTCLRSVYGIQRSLLALGLRSRGGVSIGGLLHKVHFVVGDGLVKAHELESQVAIYPRVVIAEDIINLLMSKEMPNMILFRNRVAHLVRQDSDGEYFVDYLSVDPVISGVRLAGHVKRIFDELAFDLANCQSLRKRQKLQWMLRYMEAAGAAIAETGPRRTSHAGRRFASVYYRDDENLVTFVNKMEAERQHATQRKE